MPAVTESLLRRSETYVGELVRWVEAGVPPACFPMRQASRAAGAAFSLRACVLGRRESHGHD